jgi:hypothetical protein
MFRLFSVLTLLMMCAGCGAGNSKAKLNDKPLTDAEKAAIKAEDDAVNAEESAGKPGSATAS